MKLFATNQVLIKHSTLIQCKSTSI